MTKSDTQQSTHGNTVQERVLEKITSEHISPRARWSFLIRSAMMWSFWTLSIFIGALALAVVIFASTHRYYDLYEATHDTFITFLIDMLPFVWLFIFLSMLLLAVRQLRRTNRGYRWSVSVLALSSIVFSMLLGALFHLGGFGWAFDRWLGEHSPMYVSQMEREEQQWQQPSRGRLLGTQAYLTVQPTTTVIFMDSANQPWVMRIADLGVRDRSYLESGSQVRVLGLMQSPTQFHACGVLPWMFDGPKSLVTLAETRTFFVDHMHGFDRGDEVINSDPHQEYQIAPNRTQGSPCSRLPAVQRMLKKQ